MEQLRSEILDDLNAHVSTTETSITQLERFMNQQVEKNIKEMERVRLDMQDSADSKQE